ncbi:MAG TPA: hypothetical protein DDY37_00070 [Legionella sp.]|nr:hypothetical protein [Legionella sp.]
MNGVKRLTYICLCSVFLVACSASSGSDLYLKSTNGPDLVVPQPLTTANMGDFYKLPPQHQDARVSIDPPNR